MMHRRSVLLGMAALAAGSGAAAADVETVSAPIVALDGALLAAMKAGASDSFAHRFDALAPAVDRAFALTAILQSCVGPRWSSLAPDQQATLETVFRTFTIASYVANFNSYDGQRFEVAPELRAVGAEQVVQTHLIPRAGDSTRLDYVMRQTGDEWRAVDVLFNGSISRVAVQRSDFRAMLSSGGATALMDSLRKKVADLSGGTLPS